MHLRCLTGQSESFASKSARLQPTSRWEPRDEIVGVKTRGKEAKENWGGRKKCAKQEKGAMRGRFVRRLPRNHCLSFQSIASGRCDTAQASSSVPWNLIYVLAQHRNHVREFRLTKTAVR